MGIQSFATEGLPPSQRLRYWNDITEQVFGGTYVNAEEGSFHGTMLAWRIGQLGLLRPSASHSFVGRKRTERSEEYIILHLFSRGRGRHRQRGDEADLGPGDFILSAIEHDYQFELHPHELSVVEFPKAPLLERLPNLEDNLCRRVDGSTPTARILHDFLLSLWRNGESPAAEPDWQHGVAQVFYDLLALAVRHQDGSEAGERRSRLRERIDAFIESRLADPELRTQDIAAEFGLSERSIQHLFALAGSTPSAYILERRLRTAADRLRAQPCASITEVAFDSGFNDSAYFSRCFRRRFSVAPRSWRQDGELPSG
ncbi:MAG TPA: helix-turn-helix domain-containing protein [Sphingomonadaceae bacterium]